MAKTKDAVLTPEQKELMEKEYLDFVKPSTYGNKANPNSCNSLYDDVENPELRATVEKVAATTPYREFTPKRNLVIVVLIEIRIIEHSHVFVVDAI